MQLELFTATKGMKVNDRRRSSDFETRWIQEGLKIAAADVRRPTQKDQHNQSLRILESSMSVSSVSSCSQQSSGSSAGLHRDLKSKTPPPILSIPLGFLSFLLCAHSFLRFSFGAHFPDDSLPSKFAYFTCIPLITGH